MLDTSGDYFTARWKPVYAKDLTLNKGVDNVILFQFLNQDQKPVDIANATFTFRVIDQDGVTLLLSKDLVKLQTGSGSAAVKKGQAKVTVLASEILDVVAQPANYSIEVYSTTTDSFEAVFTDDNAGARGTVNIVDSVYPQFEPSPELTAPVQINHPKQYRQGNATVVYHTSEVATNGKDTVTFQLDFDQFTGNILAQGTNIPPTMPNHGWTDIGNTRVYIDQNARDHINVVSNYLYLRLQFDQQGRDAGVTANVSGGSVSTLNLAGGGSNWIGTPRVVFDGYGTGAAAVATVTGGVVSSVVLTAGGTGYNDTPNVHIDSGSVTSIKYR